MYLRFLCYAASFAGSSLSFNVSVDNTDESNYYDADDNCDLSCRCRTFSARSESEVVAECSTDHEAENCYCAVSIAFAGHNELSERASAEEYAGESYEEHSECVPKSVSVCDRLLSQSELESAEYEVSNKSSNEDCDESPQKSCLFEENEVSHSADHAQSCSLSEETYNESCAE